MKSLKLLHPYTTNKSSFPQKNRATKSDIFDHIKIVTEFNRLFANVGSILANRF